MKKLEKLDVLMIIFAVIVCLFALVVMYGWPQGVWELGWTAVAAIATFFAAFIALFLGLSQIRSVKRARVNKAKIIMASHDLLIRRVADTLELIRKGQYKKSSLADGSKTALSGLRAIERITLEDMELISELESELSIKLARAKTILMNHFSLTGLPSAYSKKYIYENFVNSSMSKTNGYLLQIAENDLCEASRKIREHVPL